MLHQNPKRQRRVCISWTTIHLRIHSFPHRANQFETLKRINRWSPSAISSRTHSVEQYPLRGELKRWRTAATDFDEMIESRHVREKKKELRAFVFFHPKVKFMFTLFRNVLVTVERDCLLKKMILDMIDSRTQQMEIDRRRKCSSCSKCIPRTIFSFLLLLFLDVPKRKRAFDMSDYRSRQAQIVLCLTTLPIEGWLSARFGIFFSRSLSLKISSSCASSSRSSQHVYCCTLPVVLFSSLW